MPKLELMTLCNKYRHFEMPSLSARPGVLVLISLLVYAFAYIIYIQWESETLDSRSNSNNVPDDLILIGNPPIYKLGTLLGTGYVSAVYAGENIESGDPVVIKLTSVNESERNQHDPKHNLNGIPASVQKLARLDREYEMYKRLNTSRLLKAYWYGRHANFQALVVQRVGPSLQEHQTRLRNWTREDVYQIGMNVILDLEQIHEQSFIHDDIHMVRCKR
jgi:serine/threonine protein kinase